MRKVISLLILLFLFSPFLYSQDKERTKPWRADLSRFRIQTGIFNAPNFDGEARVKIYPVVNFNYRSTMTNPDTSHRFHTIELVSEFGTNYIIAPYFKIGTEIHFSDVVFADLHVGITWLIPTEFVIPFVGAQVSHTIYINENSQFEIEAGVNLVVPYIAIGYSFR